MVMRAAALVLAALLGAAQAAGARAKMEAEAAWFNNMFSSSAPAAANSSGLAIAASSPTEHAQAKAEAEAEEKALVHAKLAQRDESSDEADEEEGDTQSSSPPLISKLKGIFTELKERKGNLRHLEKTLAQEKAMLGEGKQMLQLATTKKGKRTFERQVENSEQIYKDTSGLLAASRSEAQSAAQSLIREMQQARALEGDIIAEARAQLRELSHDGKHLDMNQVAQKATVAAAAAAPQAHAADSSQDQDQDQDDNDDTSDSDQS